MNDSDDEETGKFELTSFLFGNIDERGELEDDILDNESKRHLSSLARLGFGSFIKEIVNEEGEESETNELNENLEEKSSSAIDYSDISELAEDPSYNSIKGESQTGCTSDYDADDEDVGNAIDTELMPPPPLPTEKNGIEPDEKKRKLDTPLAAMLPSKYAGVDVRELFPDFRVDKVREKFKFVSKNDKNVEVFLSHIIFASRKRITNKRRIVFFMTVFMLRDRHRCPQQLLMYLTATSMP